MRKIILFLCFLSCYSISKSQVLKGNNYLIINDSTNRIEVNNLGSDAKNFTIKCKCPFSHSGNLMFAYNKNIKEIWYTGYIEFKKIPKNWKK